MNVVNYNAASFQVHFVHPHSIGSPVIYYTSMQYIYTGLS